MTASEPEIRANILAGFDAYLASVGVALGPLMIAAGLDPDQVIEETEAIPLNSYARLLELAAATARDDCLGLHYASAFPQGGMRILGYILLNAPDLKTCFECLGRYVHMQCEAVTFRLDVSEGTARLLMECGPTFIAPRKQFQEFVLSLLVGRLSGVYGVGWRPIKAEFEYREPRCGGEYEHLFGTNLHFGASVTALTLRADQLASPNLDPDQTLFNIMKRVGDALLAQLDRRYDVVWKVGEYIVRNLALRGATLEGAAEALGLAPRRLQSELKSHQTTFDEELTRIRRALAERYLRDTEMPLTEIAFVLGFSELSGFTRAARGWLGMPPSLWRQEARRQLSPDLDA